MKEREMTDSEDPEKRGKCKLKWLHSPIWERLAKIIMTVIFDVHPGLFTLLRQEYGLVRPMQSSTIVKVFLDWQKIDCLLLLLRNTRARLCKNTISIPP